MRYLSLFALLLLIVACSSDSIEEPMPPTGDFTIWSGSELSFEKDDRSDPREETNQDRITDKVWITRGLQGSIYNGVSQFSSADNPDGTEWAFGKTDDIANLTFKGFKATHGNSSPSVVGKDMVLHLIEEDVYIDIKFSSWRRKKEGGQGGFAYTRNTE